MRYRLPFYSASYFGDYLAGLPWKGHPVWRGICTLYWESGFAEGLGKPVIYSCKKSVFDKKKTHLDTSHLHTIISKEDKPEAATEKLKATIRATLPHEAILEDETED